MARGLPQPVRDAVDRVRDRTAPVRERWDATRDGMTDRQRALLRAVRFLAVFTAMAAPLYLLLAAGWDASVFRHGFARAAAAVLNGIGIPATSELSFVSTEGMLLDVTRDSTGWKSALAVTALVVATRRPWRTRVQGIVFGLVLVAAANLLRIVTMVYAVVVFGIDYELLHTVLWRWGLTGIVLAAWAVWLWQPAPFSRVRDVAR